MRLLISPVCIEEARTVARLGCEIIDIKNVKEGSLGAQPPWVIEQIISELGGKGAVFSVALGDLPNKPGTIGLAAYAVAKLKPHFIKAGLYDAKNYDDALAMMTSIVKSIRMVNKKAIIVASGYADYKRFGGVSCEELVPAAKKAGADVVMLDTAIKDGKTLFDALSVAEIQAFVDSGHKAGMKVALAGSVKLDDFEALCKINPDIVGVRGAVCKNGDRKKPITADGIRKLQKRVKAATAGAKTASRARK
jgi:hypothetical protein